jgi:hypothetical protein
VYQPDKKPKTPGNVNDIGKISPAQGEQTSPRSMPVRHQTLLQFRTAYASPPASTPALGPLSKNVSKLRVVAFLVHVVDANMSEMH